MIETDLSNASETPPPRLANANPADLWSFFVRGWRSACGWMCVLMLLRGVVVPMVQLCRGQPVEPIDWAALAVFAGLLVAARTFDKAQGTA